LPGRRTHQLFRRPNIARRTFHRDPTLARNVVLKTSRLCWSSS
jgi:hypothetical protein